MSDYKSYLLRQMGLREVTGLKPVDIDPESIDPKELEKGIGVEKEHTNDEEMAKKIALHHLAEDPQYYSRMSKAGLKEFSPLQSIMSPTAKSPQVLGIAVRGSVTGGLPSGAMPSLGPTSLTPSDTAIAPEGSGVDPKSSAALGGLELVSKQSPNSVIVDKTPQNKMINSASPKSDIVPPTLGDAHPAQIQQVNGEPAQALTGTTDDKAAPMGEKPEPEKFEVDAQDEDDTIGIDIDVPKGEGEEEPEDEKDDLKLSNIVKEGRCEDYPCCGHGPGECPDHDEEGNEVYRCAKCGRQLPPHSYSSMCGSCLNRMYQAMDDPTGQDLDTFQENKKPDVNKTFARHMKLMEDKLGLKKECKPCGCEKPNTGHPKKTKKLTSEQLRNIQEKLKKKVALTEQEKLVSEMITSTLESRKSKKHLYTKNVEKQ